MSISNPTPGQGGEPPSWPPAWLAAMFPPAVDGRARDTARRRQTVMHMESSVNAVRPAIRGEWLSSAGSALPSGLRPVEDTYTAFSQAPVDVLPSTFASGTAHQRDRRIPPGCEAYWFARLGAVVEAAADLSHAEMTTALLRRNQRRRSSAGIQRRRSSVGDGGSGKEDGEDELDAETHEQLSLIEPRYLVPPPYDPRAPVNTVGRDGARRHYMARGRCFVESEQGTIVDSRHYAIAARSAISVACQCEAVSRASIVEQERVQRWALLVDRAFDLKLHGYRYGGARDVALSPPRSRSVGSGSKPPRPGGSSPPGRSRSSASERHEPLQQIAGSLPEPLVQLCVYETAGRRQLEHARSRALRRYEEHSVALSIAQWKEHDRAFAAAVGTDEAHQQQPCDAVGGSDEEDA